MKSESALWTDDRSIQTRPKGDITPAERIPGQITAPSDGTQNVADMYSKSISAQDTASRAESAGRVWIVLPALLPWFCAGAGRRVGSLGPGLTSESADAARAVLRNDLSAGPQVFGTHRRCRSDLPGLGKRPGFTGPAASGCVPSLNLRKGWH